MSDLLPIEPESAEIRPGDAVELMVIEDEFGISLVGTNDAIASFTVDWGVLLSPAPVDSGTTLSKIASKVFGSRGIASAFVSGNRSEGSLAPVAEPNVTYHRMVRDVATGRIKSNAAIPNPALTAAHIGPQMAAIAALEVAMAAQFDEVHVHLDVIEDKVDELLRLASAERLGDVYGHHRILSAKLQGLAKGHVLTQADWSEIAPMGIDLQVGVERLRVHAFKQLETLDGNASPGKRSEQLEAMLYKNRLGESLQLLVVAQKSLFQWLQLKLEQVRNTESEHVDQTITSARATIRDQHDADIQLVERIREILKNHAVLHLTEVHHKLIARGLGKRRDAMQEMLDHFIQTRNLQITEWDSPEHATFSDVFFAARDRTSDLLTTGRQQLARGAANVAAWAEPDASKDSDAPKEADGPNDREDSKSN